MSDEPIETLARTFILSQRYRKEELPDVPDVDMFGTFGSTTQLVHGTSMCLLLSPGRYSESGNPVTLPFVHINVDGGAAVEDTEVSPLINGIMPIENAALFLVNLAYDLKHSAAQLVRMGSAGEVERHRLEQFRQFAAHASNEALNCVYLLDHILEDQGPDEDSAEPSLKRAKPGLKVAAAARRKRPSRKAAL